MGFVPQPSVTLSEALGRVSSRVLPRGGPVVDNSHFEPSGSEKHDNSYESLQTVTRHMRGTRLSHSCSDAP